MAAPDTTDSTKPPVNGASVTVVAKGITGTTNYGGDIFAESNAKLLHQQAYGQAGTRNWGEWEELRRTDAAVAAALDFVCGPIRDARVDVEPTDDSPRAQAIADLVRWNLTEALEPTFPELLTQATKGFLSTGFALFEPTFAKRKHELFPGGEGYAIDKVAQRLPSTLAYNAWLEHPDGSDLRAVRQQGPRGSQWVTVEIPAEQLLLFSWQREGNNYAGFSAFRAAWYPAQIRKELLRLVGVTYQREGAGVPVMEATDRAAELTPKQREDMETLLANLVYHENASLVPPAGWSLKWTFSGGANKGHVLDAYHRLGLVILEQVQAQQLALGTGDTGSRSVGEVHDASARAFISSVIALIEGVLNGVGSRPYTGLVRRLVDANFGPQDNYPRLRLTLKQAQLSPKDLLDAVTKGVAAKALTVTADDENALREKLGLSPIDAEAREAELERRAALAPQMAPEQGGEDDAPKGRPLQASAQRSAWTPWRPLRASEARVPWAKRAAYFDAQRDVFEKRVRPVVVAMLAKAAPLITSAMADGRVLPDEVATIPLDTSRLAKTVAAYCDEVRKAGGESLREEMPPHTLRAAAEEEDEREEDVKRDADDVERAESNRLVRRIVNRTRGELEREAIDALRTGGTAQDVLERSVMRQVDSGAFRADAGYVTTKLFNVGRDEAARLMGGIAEVEYSALLDSGTCAACRGDDGRTAAFGSAEHDAMVPPNRDCSGGDNCRCLLVMIPDDGGDE